MKQTFWIKLAAKKSRYNRWELSGVPKASVGKPSTAQNEIALRMEIEIPDTYFEEPQLSIAVKVPDKTPPQSISINVDELGKLIEEKIGMKVTVSMGETIE